MGVQGWSFIMRSLLLVMVLVILAVTILDPVEARCEKSRVSSVVIKKKLEPFTKMEKNNKGKKVPVADSPCWYDLTKSNCGTCIKGGKQCGYPMSKYCQSPKSKFGCPAAMNLAKFRQAQANLAEAEERADLNEQALGKLKAKGRA